MGAPPKLRERQPRATESRQRTPQPEGEERRTNQDRQRAIRRLLARQMENRMVLQQPLRGLRISLLAICPTCRTSQSVEQVLAGVRRSERDVSTQCATCEQRFVALLSAIEDGRASRAEFLAHHQLRARLSADRALAEQRPAVLRRADAALYLSALVLYGSLKGAYGELGIDYAHDETPVEWRRKVTPYLGRVSDALLASCAAVETGAVRDLRTELGIAAYHPRGR